MRVAGRPFTLEGRRVCPHLMAALPDRLGRLPGRRVVADRRSVAAWGDPPVVLRCGVAPRPGPVGHYLVLDGVWWTTDAGGGTVTWTTVGRRVNVQVLVPATYDSQGPLLAGLSPPLNRTISRA